MLVGPYGSLGVDLRESKVFRPNLDNVESLSFGKGAKRNRGMGSRYVCHRLNIDERTCYELAKKAGYLTVRGTDTERNARTVHAPRHCAIPIVKDVMHSKKYASLLRNAQNRIW